MKKILFALALLLFPLIMVGASDIYKIDMDIYVDKNGNASVTETWDANVNEGTEGWHPYYNLGDSVISDVKASIDGNSFTTVSSWDEGSSFNSKRYKVGLYYPSDEEVDICFGITNYGRHTYVVKYSISNFVKSVKDADMLYWTLLPYGFSAEPQNVHIKIYSDFKYSDSLDVWGYGNYGGTAYVYDGYIEMNSDGQLDSDEYMTILVKYPLGTFNTSSKLDNDFNYYYLMAEEGTTHYVEESEKTSIWDIIGSIISTLFFIFIWISIIYGASKSNNKGNYRFGTTGNKVRKDVPNFRDIPCNKDIYRAYFISDKYNINKKKTDLLGAILLKWLKNGNVRVEKTDKKGLFKTTQESNIIFVSEPTAILLEQTIYKWMFEASKDGKLEANEFKKWCNSNYSKILKWFDDIINYERDLLIDEGEITKTVETKAKIFTTEYYDVDPSLMQEAEQLQGLKNFLKEFTIIDKREPIEVNLWDEYLMYAQIFGMADEVAKQFKKLYPEITENMNNLGYDYDDIVFLYVISNTGISSANAAQSRAQSYSAGGGGFSSGGGGGGSFGGGGGGGGFR